MVREDVAAKEGGDALPPGTHRMPDGSVMRDEDMPQGEAMAQSQQGPALSGGAQPASPEEQRLYNHFVAKAMMLTYDEKMFPQVLSMLEGEGDPVEGLARATAMIVARVASAAEQAGQQLSGDVVLHAGTEVLEDLAELAREAGIKDFSQDPDALEASYFRALDHFRMTLQDAGAIDQEAAKRDLGMLQEMDQAGQLEGMFRDLAKQDPRSARAGGAKAEPEPKGRGGLMSAAGRA